MKSINLKTKAGISNIGKGLPKSSLRNRLLGLMFGITLVTILVVTVIVFVLSQNFIRMAKETSSQSLREQAEAYLVQINTAIADQNELILDRAARDVKTVADSATSIFDGELPNGYWPAKEHVFKGENGQYLNSSEDISSVFIPVTSNFDAVIQKEVEQTAYLDLVMEPIFKNNPDAAAIYFGTSHEVTRYYPNIQLGKVVPPDFQVTKRVWYTSSVQVNQDPSKPEAVWTPVYLDATGLGLVTTVAIPVYRNSGEIVGVVGLDITLGEISANIQQTSAFLKTGYSFLIDKEGKAIILPDQGYLDILGREPETGEFGTSLADPKTNFSPIFEQMVAGSSGFGSLNVGGRDIFIAFSPVKSTDWSLGSVVAADDVLAAIPLLQSQLTQTSRSLLLTRVIPLTLMLSLLMIIFGLLWVRRVSNPIQKLASTAAKIGEGQWNTEIPAIEFQEFGLLANTISNMKDQLSQSFLELEKRVAERTSALEHRALQLETSAEVMRVIATVHDLDSLLTRITQLISERFGFYHVGIFLVDESRDNVVLRASNSLGGQRMLARGHKLRIGETGIVGTVAGSSQPRITKNVISDKVYYNNPDLPETRSEMAFPLISGETLQGVLDVQSKVETVFAEEDVTVFQILADQITVAIENAQLFTDKERALEDLRQAYGRLSYEGWQKWLEKQPNLGYRLSDSGELRKTTGDWNEEMQQAKQTGTLIQSSNMVAIPIKFRDNILGVMKFKKPEKQGQWTEDEKDLLVNLVDQMSLALDSARLYEETRRRADRERLTGEISTKVRSSNDPQIILQTAVRELRQVLNASQIQVMLQENVPNSVVSDDVGSNGK